MNSNGRHPLNENVEMSHPITDDDSGVKVLSKAETLYVSLMCLVVSCLSSVTFEVGARSPLGHSVTKSATFNALFRRNYNMIVKIPMGNFVSSLISTICLTLGEKYRIPYLYLPWLVNTFKGMIFNEGPALVSLSYNQLPYAVIPASTFGFMTIILFGFTHKIQQNLAKHHIMNRIVLVEEFCLWCDVFSSFKRCWVDYNSHDERIKNQDYHHVMKTKMNDKANGECEQKINLIDKSNIVATMIDEPNAKVPFTRHIQKESFTYYRPRRTRSLIPINYSHCYGF